MQLKTLQSFSPSGYFALEKEQDDRTKKIFNWLNKVKTLLEEESNRFNEFYRLYLSLDYDSLMVGETFLNLIAERQGLKNYGLSKNLLKNLLIYTSTPYKRKLSSNLDSFINFLFLQEWITDFSYALAGYNSRSNFAETLIIFSNSLTLPVKPNAQNYTPLTWNAPVGWTKIPSSSTYYTRGYLFENQIVWSEPIATNVVVKYSRVSNLVSLPLSPSLYDIAIVSDDNTNDFQSIYFWDGFYWLKCSTPNESQKNIESTTALKGSLVFAPNDDINISSSTKPPNDGYSMGYGFYGIWGQGSLVNSISFKIVLTESGNNFLGLIIQLLKRIKPMGNLILMIFEYNGNSTQVQINDINSI